MNQARKHPQPNSPIAVCILFLVCFFFLGTEPAHAQTRCKEPPVSYTGTWVIRQYSELLGPLRTDQVEITTEIQHSGDAISMDLGKLGIKLIRSELDREKYEAFGSHTSNGSVNLELEFFPIDLRFEGKIKYAMVVLPYTFEGEMVDRDRDRLLAERRETVAKCEAEVADSNAAIQRRIEQLTRERGDWEQRYRRATAQHQSVEGELQTRAADLDRQLGNANREKGRQADAIKRLESTVATLKAELERERSDVRRLEALLEKTRSDAAASIAATERERRQLEERVKNLQAQLDDLRPGISTVDDRPSSADSTTDQTASLQSQIQELQNSRTELEAQLAQAQQRLESQAAQLNAAIERLRAQAALQSQLKEKDQEVGAAGTRIAELEQTIAAMNESIEAERRSLSDSVVIIAGLRTKLVKAQEDIAALAHELGDLPGTAVGERLAAIRNTLAGALEIRK